MSKWGSAQVLDRYNFRGDRDKLQISIMAVVKEGKGLNEAAKLVNIAPTTLSPYVRIARQFVKVCLSSFRHVHGPRRRMGGLVGREDRESALLIREGGVVGAEGPAEPLQGRRLRLPPHRQRPRPPPRHHPGQGPHRRRRHRRLPRRPRRALPLQRTRHLLAHLQEGKANGRSFQDELISTLLDEELCRKERLAALLRFYVIQGYRKNDASKRALIDALQDVYPISKSIATS